MVDIDTLYRKNATKQLKMLQRMLSGDTARAEDVLQEAYSRALKYQGSYRADKASIQTWFNSIMFNTLRDELKGISVTDPLSGSEPDEVDYVFKAENFKQVETNIEKYTKDRDIQSILYCFYILGYSCKDISQIVSGVSVTKVTTTCSRFKTWMKGQI